MKNLTITAAEFENELAKAVRDVWSDYNYTIESDSYNIRRNKEFQYIFEFTTEYEVDICPEYFEIQIHVQNTQFCIKSIYLDNEEIDDVSYNKITLVLETEDQYKFVDEYDEKAHIEALIHCLDDDDKISLWNDAIATAIDHNDSHYYDGTYYFIYSNGKQFFEEYYTNDITKIISAVYRSTNEKLYNVNDYYVIVNRFGYLVSFDSISSIISTFNIDYLVDLISKYDCLLQKLTKLVNAQK